MDIISSTDNYLSLFLSLPNITPLSALAAFFLTMARILPIMILAPFFGATNLPAAVKMMFSISICAILLPQNLFHLQGNLVFDLAFIGFMLKELLIGFILGFLITIPFYIAQSSGSLIDHIRGASSLQISDPTTKSQTGPVGIFYNYVLIAVFFSIGGPFLFIDALGRSFTLIPINEVLNPAFFSLQLPFWQMITGLLTQILAISIQLGAPSIIGILMGEMFLGIANRLAPQVQIVFLGIPLKSWIGLALLAAAWYYVMMELGKGSLNWIDMIDRTIRQAAPALKG